MALNKLSTSKKFHVHYYGCTEATTLLNDDVVRNTIDLLRNLKNVNEFISAVLNISRNGIKIVYNDKQKFSTVVPSSMIAGSAICETSFHDTVGVVYISPLTSRHYPAFVHVYRCETPRFAKKLLSRFRAYLLIESHRQELVRLEQQLTEHNLLKINHSEIDKTNKDLSSSSTTANNTHLQQTKVDQLKLITNELKTKIKSSDPILFPPKDYDTLHAAHGDIHRAHEWRSTEPTIVGYSQIDPDEHRKRQYIQSNVQKNNEVVENQKPITRIPSDATSDPVDTVNQAFEFLAHETSSTYNDNGADFQHAENRQQNKAPIYRFRPPQTNGVITKKLFPRHNNNYDLSNGTEQSNLSSQNNYLYNNNNNHHHHHIQNEHRARSETHLHYDQQINMPLNTRYNNRFMNNNPGPITTNPLWINPSVNMVGSQPNLLSYTNYSDVKHLHQQLSPQMEKRTTSALPQQPIYSSYPNNKPEMIKDYQQHRLAPVHHGVNRKQMTQSQYLDTNEFILCPSDEQPLRNSQYSNRHLAKDQRPHSMVRTSAMLDVYY